MRVEVQLEVLSSRVALWALLTDIERAASMISGITQIELLERPASGLVGLRWRETRMLFGKPAVAEKWIAEAVEQESYTTRAESDGFVFLTTHRISAGRRGGLLLSGRHDSLPQTLKARLMLIPMSLLFRGVIRKAALADLIDLKAAAERTQ